MDIISRIIGDVGNIIETAIFNEVLERPTKEIDELFQGYDSRAFPPKESILIDPQGDWVVIEGAHAQRRLEYYGGWEYIEETMVLGDYKFYSGDRVTDVIEAHLQK